MAYFLGALLDCLSSTAVAAADRFGENSYEVSICLQLLSSHWRDPVRRESTTVSVPCGLMLLLPICFLPHKEQFSILQLWTAVIKTLPKGIEKWECCGRCHCEECVYSIICISFSCAPKVWLDAVVRARLDYREMESLACSLRLKELYLFSPGKCRQGYIGDLCLPQGRKHQEEL